MNEIISIENGTAILDPDVCDDIVDFERMIKRIKSQEDALRKAILAEMSEKHIMKLQTDELTISYISPTMCETFDSKRFRKDNPDIYDEYVDIKPVAESIRIKVAD